MNDSNMYLIALLMRGLNYSLDDYNLILTGNPEDFERTEEMRGSGKTLRESLDCLLDELQARKGENDGR